MKSKSLLWTMLLAFGVWAAGVSSTFAQPAPQSANSALEPKALEILKASGDRLAAAHSLSFTAVELVEHPSRQGHPLAYATKSDVVLQRPDKLRVITSGDGPPSAFYDDGKTMTAIAKANNLKAVADAPPTIDATLESVYHSAGIYFPFSDLILSDPYRAMAGDLRLAYYIGQSNVVAGTTTDMVAYVIDDVFMQLWIGAEDKLPRVIHAVSLDDTSRFRRYLELSNWQLGVAIAPDTFAPSSAPDAKRVEFVQPHPQLPLGARPPAKVPKVQQ